MYFQRQWNDIVLQPARDEVNELVRQQREIQSNINKKYDEIVKNQKKGRLLCEEHVSFLRKTKKDQMQLLHDGDYNPKPVQCFYYPPYPKVKAKTSKKRSHSKMDPDLEAPVQPPAKKVKISTTDEEVTVLKGSTKKKGRTM